MRRPDPRNPQTLLQFHKKRAARADIEQTFARIEVLTKKASAAFVFLLTFLAFAVVTLLGVDDADFFLEDRQTALPLLDVLIPTTAFFYFAPILIATLFANLHLQLVKLWSALATAPLRHEGRPLSENVHPWIITDFALHFRRDARDAQAPLAWLTRLVGLVLAYMAAPLVLGWFWIRAMPKHDVLLTFVVGVTLLVFSMIVATESWRRMRLELSHRNKSLAIPALALCLLALIATTISWFKVVEPLTHYVPSDNLSRRALNSTFEKPSWWRLPFELSQANLENVNFVPKPDSWRPFATAKADYWPNWCEAHSETLSNCTRIWEQGSRDTSTLLDQFDTAWLVHRKAQIRDLPNRDYRNQDWRNANLQASELQGAELRGGKLQGADLSYANLNGADMWAARLPDALLWSTELQSANLATANLKNAILVDAKLDAANLNGINLQGALLWVAKLHGASLASGNLQDAGLVEADLQGADLRHVQLSEKTDFRDATLRGAIFASVDLSVVSLSQSQIDESFGDFDVVLPKGINRPAHWRPEDAGPISVKELLSQWREWQISIGFTPKITEEQERFMTALPPRPAP